MPADKEYIKLKQEDCQNCYRCIRNCPVKAISFSDRQARIVEDECMLCGRCYVTCPQNAKDVRTDLGRGKALLASGAHVHASIAPSFVSYFNDMSIESMNTALQALGFAGASETAIGATVVKNRYDEILMEGRQSVVISSCCHSITLLLQKHFPEALSCLAPVLSPMQAHCAAIKAHNPEAKTIFIGPCISKKAEADQFPGTVDCVLTFDELASWLDEKSIVLERTSAQGLDGKSRLFPVSGGILRSMSRKNPAYTYISIDGMESCIRAIQNILRGDVENCFIEMSACEGSCIGGPVMRQSIKSPLSGYTAVEAYAGKQDFALDAPAGILEKVFAPDQAPTVRISESAICEVLRKTGKTRLEHELNCGSCGYDTCREKAEAVVRGKADVSMCLPFLKEKAESFSDTIFSNTPNGIIVLNEMLLVQQINNAACRMLNLHSPEDILGSKVIRVLDPDIFVEVMSSGEPVYERPAFLAEYQRHVRQTVLHDRNFHVLILIMRDVTAEENARAQTDARNWQTAEITDQVIEKQMRVVQEIASLLGETAAETKIALTRLKESLKSE